MEDGRVVGQHLVDLSHDLFRTLLRGTRVGRDGHEDGTRVLIRHKTCLGGIHQYGQCSNTHNHDTGSDDAVIDHALHTFLIFSDRLVKYAVETSVEAGHKALIAFVLLSFVRFQEHGTKSRRERQGVDSRDDDAHSHGHTELTVEGTTRATHERYRDEHGSHDKRDGDDGAGDLVHGVDGGSERVVVTLVELGVNGLDDHDGIIDHDGDSQQQRR